jgi:hypothetical protein
MTYLQDRQRKITIWKRTIAVVLLVLFVYFGRGTIIESLSPQAMYVQGIFAGVKNSLFSVFHETGVYFSTKKSLDTEVMRLTNEVDRLTRLEGENMLLERQLAEYESDSTFFREGTQYQQVRFSSPVSVYGTRIANLSDDGVTSYSTPLVYGPRGGVIGIVENMSDGLLKVLLISESVDQKREVVFGTSETRYEAEPRKNNLLIARVPQVEGIEVDTPVFLITDTGTHPLGKVVRSDANPQDPFAVVFISLLDDATQVDRGYLQVYEKNLTQ